MKVTIQQEDVTIVNIYAPTAGAPKYTEQLTKEIMESNTTMVRDCHTPPTSMDRSSEQGISWETVASKDRLDQMGLTDLFRTEHTFLSSAQGAHSRINHICGRKTGLYKLKD